MIGKCAIRIRMAECNNDIALIVAHPIILLAAAVQLVTYSAAALRLASCGLQQHSLQSCCCNICCGLNYMMTKLSRQ